jgi:hypothetical protein
MLCYFYRASGHSRLGLEWLYKQKPLYLLTCNVNKRHAVLYTRRQRVSINEKPPYLLNHETGDMLSRQIRC